MVALENCLPFAFDTHTHNTDGSCFLFGFSGCQPTAQQQHFQVSVQKRYEACTVNEPLPCETTEKDFSVYGSFGSRPLYLRCKFHAQYHPKWDVGYPHLHTINCAKIDIIYWCTQGVCVCTALVRWGTLGTNAREKIVHRVLWRKLQYISCLCHVPCYARRVCLFEYYLHSFSLHYNIYER